MAADKRNSYRAGKAVSMDDEWCAIEEAGRRLGLTWRTVKMYLGEGLLSGKKTKNPSGRWAWSHVSRASMAEYQRTHRPYCKPTVVGCRRCEMVEGVVDGLCPLCRDELRTGRRRFYPLPSLLASTMGRR